MDFVYIIINKNEKGIERKLFYNKEDACNAYKVLMATVGVEDILSGNIRIICSSVPLSEFTEALTEGHTLSHISYLGTPEIFI